MKMSYRHRLPILLMVIAVSVFLFFCLDSCGIPTYWQPKNTNVITKGSTSATDEVNFTVDVNFYSGDDGSNAPNIGLVLLYVYSNSTYSSLDSELVKKFNSNYRGSIPNGLSTLSSENNVAVWDFTVNDIDYNVYAFSPSSDNGISAWQYNRALSFNTDFSCSFSLKLNSDIDGVGLYINDELDGTQTFGLDSTNLSSLQESNYVHVYAAISAQGGANYSNIYWSNLTYVGSFSEFNTGSTTSSD